MLDLDEDVVVFVQAKQTPTHERQLRRIEPATAFRFDQSARFILALVQRHTAEIFDREIDSPRWLNSLDRLTIEFGESGAKDLVPPHDLGERAIEYVDIEFAHKPDRQLAGVSDGVRREFA